MTDRERIATLLRQGLQPAAIAAILNTDLATVSDLQRGAGALPGGGSDLIAAADPTLITTHTFTPDWTTVAVDDGTYFPLGPVHLPAAGQYAVGLTAEVKGEPVNSYLSFCFATVEGGLLTIPIGADARPSGADWPTSAWLSDGHLQVADVLVWAVGPTDVYALFACSDQPGTGLSAVPIQVRNRRLTALPK